jgi:hypothetical protein
VKRLTSHANAGGVRNVQRRSWRHTWQPCLQELEPRVVLAGSTVSLAALATAGATPQAAATLSTDAQGSVSGVRGSLSAPAVAALAGLTDWWPGEGNANDIVGGQNGTLLNGVSFIPGAVGQAFHFDGVDDRVLINSPFPFNQAGDATMAFWINCSPTAHQGIFWTRGDSADTNRFNIFINSNATFGFDYRSPSGALHMLVGSGANTGVDIPRDTWTHLAIVRAGNVYSVYKNGTLAASATDHSPDLPTAGQWQFSGRSGFIYRGGLDEVQLYDRALSAAEIKQIFGAARFHTASAVGDFNGDGKLDVVTTNPNGATVGVRLGNGDGTFAAAVNYGTGTNPSAVLVTDVNKDGGLDLVVANSGSNTVSVLLGNGDGTFAAAVNDAVASNPVAVALGDFNADGNLDLVTADSGSKSVSVLLGNGDGTFQSAVSYAARNNPNSVAVGDFNGDGKLDLAVANLHTVSILLGNGDGTFQAQTVFGANSPHGLLVEDVNHDGALDLVVDNAHRVSVLLGNGDGTFQAPVYSGNGIQPTGGAMAEFNHDGVLDLVTANLHSVSVLLGNGDGTFQAPVYYQAGGKSRSVVVGDVNGDGNADLIVTDPSGVSVLLGNGDGTFASPLRS